MKIFMVCTLFVVSSLAEPPVNTRYLPPQQGLTGRTPPSQAYGPPGVGVFGPHRQTDAVLRGRPFAVSRRPSNQYGLPSLSNQYGTPQITPSAQYRAPQTTPSAQYGAPQTTPSAQYGAPQITPSANYGVPTPSSQYGLPQAGFGGQSVGDPSQLYGAPGFGINGGQHSQSAEYLPPGARGGYGGNDGSIETANYNFEYMVKDDQSGNDFGHRESRFGDKAEGVYYVVLPDGRKQTVEYEADQDGYKPRVSYQDTGRGAYWNSIAAHQDNPGGPY